MALLVLLVALASSGVARRWAVSVAYENGWFHLLTERAAADADGKPLTVLVGTSQSKRGLDPRTVEAVLDDGSFVTNVGIDGTPVSGYPYFVRRLLARQKVAAVVVELSWLSHDQFQGMRFVRPFIEAPAVRQAIERNSVGYRYLEPTRHGDWVPLTDVGRQVRNAFDAYKRSPGLRESVAERAPLRGWTPVAVRHSRERVVKEREASLKQQPKDFVDDFIPHGMIAAIAELAAVCREADVPLVCFVLPVNRELAPDVPVLRHFEARMNNDVLPALKELGVPVVMPPDHLFQPEFYTDHVHLHADAVESVSRWLAGAIAPHLR